METLNIPTTPISPEEAPKTLLDQEIEKAEGSLRHRIAKRFGRLVLGKEIATKRVRGLREIRDTTGSVDVVGAMMDEESRTKRDRIARRFGKFMFGTPEESGHEVRSGNYIRLAAIRDDLEQRGAIAGSTVETLPSQGTVKIVPEIAMHDNDNTPTVVIAPSLEGTSRADRDSTVRIDPRS